MKMIGYGYGYAMAIKIRSVLFLLLLVIVTFLDSSATIVYSVGFASSQTSHSTVILVTLDGVCWQEVFTGADREILKPIEIGAMIGPLLPFLNPEINGGNIVGNRSLGQEIVLTNRSYASLPCYQTLMAGAVQPCHSNACGRIQVEAFPETIQRKLNLPKWKVVTIASWEKIKYSVEHEVGKTFVNAGIEPLWDSGTDIELGNLNTRQEKERPPWANARFDQFTFAHALRYLKRHTPRFLFLSLNDSDEWGHLNEYDKYVKALQNYNRWLYELQKMIIELSQQLGTTHLIVTTDHGRGTKKDWVHHGSGYPESKYIWIYLKSFGSTGSAPHLELGEKSSHLTIRPLVMKAFGIE